MKLMTTTQVWEGYNAEELELNTFCKEENESYSEYTYLAKRAADGDAVIGIKVYKPLYESQNVILLIGSYRNATQTDIIKEWVDKGYTVCLPDYCGIEESRLTFYPESLEYGYFDKTEGHMDADCPTPLDTSLYLYCVAIRRAITFIQREINKENIVVVGLNEGTEIAIMTAGEDDRLCGLICINGASYLEYVKYNKYGGKDFELNDDMLSWITGVSSMSYAKKVEIPVMFALGSNGTLSDIDRLSNIFNIIPHNKIRAVICPKYINNIDYKAFNSVTDFIKDCFLGSMPPEMPDIKIDLNADGSIYADVIIDKALAIERVKVYYSSGEYNHATRYWKETAGESVGTDEFIAKLDIPDEETPLFTFAEVEYKNGLITTSLPFYYEVTKNIGVVKTRNDNPIVFQYSGKETGFTEVSTSAIIVNSSVIEKSLPIGLKGICCQNGSLISFAVGTKRQISDEKLLQFDVYTEKKNEILSVTVITGGNNHEEFTADIRLECQDTFVSIKLACNDFKNSVFSPLQAWENMKGIRINNSNIAIGKIMFI